MKNKLYIIIAGILIFVFYFSINSYSTDFINDTIVENEFAEDVSELREKRKEAQEKIKENTAHLDYVQGEISDLLLQIQELSNDIYKREIEVAVLKGEIDELNAQIDQVQGILEEVEDKHDRRKKLLAERVIAQYEAGDVVYLDFLLNSNGLIEFISNYYMIGEILNYDEELIEDYERQKERVAKIKDELDVCKINLKYKRDEQEKQAIVLGNKKVIKNSQMANLSEQERELQNTIDEYQQEVQKIEVELLIILTSNLGSDYVGGVLAWPVPGYTGITSKYGMRIHPISGVYKMHMGVDVGAPKGAYFVAANDGIVVTSRYSPSYGNLVVVDHGGGLSTLYAHGTERLVEVGDTVTRGQPVLTVGSTGISTAPHAHFEVRKNGISVEPLDYILKQNITYEIEEEQINEEED